MKHQGRTSGQVGPKLTVDDISEYDSGRQVKRYIRLTSAQLEELDYRKLYEAYSPTGRKSAADPRVIFKVQATFGYRKNKSSWGTIKRRGFVSDESEKKP